MICSILLICANLSSYAGDNQIHFSDCNNLVFFVPMETDRHTYAMSTNSLIHHGFHLYTVRMS